MFEPTKDNANLIDKTVLPTVQSEDLKKSNLHYYVLIMASLLSFGNFFIFDNPVALQTELQRDLEIDSVEYNLFYSVYSFPNIILPIFGGLLVDRIGDRSSNIIFTVLIAIGQALFAFAVMNKQYPIALLGRIIFGLGGENLNISQFNTIVKWMNKDELSMALSITVSTNRISTVLNDNITPTIAEYTSLSFSLWVGFMLCGFSVIMACILFFIGKEKERFLQKNEELNDFLEQEKFSIKDVKNFSFSFWLLAINNTLVCATVYCLNNILSNLFQERFGYSTVEAGRIISITFVLCGLFCPFFGVVLDKYGQRVYFLILSGVLVLLSHVLFLSTPDSFRPIGPILYMIPIGLGFSISSAASWSSISYVVIKGYGTAYGIMLAMLNTALGIFPVCVGYIQENTFKYEGYYWVSVMLAFVSFLGVLSSIALFFVNKKDGAKLFSKSSPEKHKLMF